ncbi:MAG: alpha/beta hydrolase [Ilumatobacteraceae bacterium]|nr:alpha/beta hydrolase [Ilumatobacteraceae bacterium]
MAELPPGWVPHEGPLASIRCGSGPRLVFVHGFTQTGRSWLPVADAFTADHEVVLVDAPGHGRSSHVRVDLRLGADLIANVGGRATYIGYSMGGRFLLHLALAYPHLVRSVALLGATAGISNDDERNARRNADEALATEIETIGVDAFLERWLAQPMFATLPDYAKGLDDRAQNTASGLASSLRLAGTGSQLSLWDRIPHIQAPTLTMAGELDPKFTALAQQLAAAIGRNAVFRPIAAAGHAAHLEHPFAVVGVLRDWLTSIRQNPRTPSAVG